MLKVDFRPVARFFFWSLSKRWSGMMSPSLQGVVLQRKKDGMVLPYGRGIITVKQLVWVPMGMIYFAIF